jgi:hypothetical protein
MRAGGFVAVGPALGSAFQHTRCDLTHEMQRHARVIGDAIPHDVWPRECESC